MSRVVPAISVTILRSSPIRALMVEDFPTLGRPTMAILGSSSMFSIGSVVKCETTLSSRSPVPEPLIEATGKISSPTPSL